MIANRNPETNIAYGYISARSLDSDLVNELQMNGTDVYYEDAWKEYLISKLAEATDEDGELSDDFDEDAVRQEFNDSYSPDEPVHEGTKDGVKYRTSWLGGALNVWVFESPHITHLARQCSPCVPGAGDLDHLDGNYTCYDVPPDWREHHD